MRRRNDRSVRPILRRIAAAAVAALAASTIAAAPSVEAVTLISDEVNDTAGLTSPAHVDGRVDITTLRYERAGAAATFTIEVADLSDTAPEDSLGAQLQGGVAFRVDGCWYAIRLDGRMMEGCAGGGRLIGRVGVTIAPTINAYHLSFNFAELDVTPQGNLRPGRWADAPRVWLDRSHLDWTDPLPDVVASRKGIGLGGCTFCGGQWDSADDDLSDWQL